MIGGQLNLSKKNGNRIKQTFYGWVTLDYFELGHYGYRAIITLKSKLKKILFLLIIPSLCLLNCNRRLQSIPDPDPVLVVGLYIGLIQQHRNAKSCAGDM